MGNTGTFALIHHVGQSKGLHFGKRTIKRDILSIDSVEKSATLSSAPGYVLGFHST